MKYMCVHFLCLTHISNACPTYVAKLAVYWTYICKNCPNGQDEEDCPGVAAGQSGKYTGHTHVRTVRTVKTKKTVRE